MKAIHINSKLSYAALLAEAKKKEINGELEDAASIYKKCIQVKPKQELPYNRLMIVYRKQKEYKKEKAFIQVAIKAFEDANQTRLTHNNTIKRLSRSILKSTGLVDGKGKHIFDHEPIRKWRRRLQTLEKKIKS